MRLSHIHAAFARAACAPNDEAALSAVVARLLTSAGLEFRSEVKLDGNARNRIDYVVDRVGLELKTEGSPAAVLRQLDRYAAAEELDALILVTTRRALAHRLPSELRGKPLSAINLGAL